MKLAVFQEKQIRKIYHNDEWYFSVVDVVAVLTDSVDSKDYWYRLKKRMSEDEKSELSTICRQLKLRSSDWKKYNTDCANTKGIFRIIQSIPSQKAEPFKKWLAQVWYERVQEIENPELAMNRMKNIYEQKWYSKNWIDKRIRWIAIRKDLTDEWNERWIGKLQYWILTAEISKATFRMTPNEYKTHKWLTKKSQNLRDNMTDLELIFTMLGEKVTTEISQMEKPITFNDNKKVANRWWKVAWNARKETEKEIWKSVISKKNFLNPKQNLRKTKIKTRSF
jgi:DNA-damage-inducible protein D